VAFFILPLMHMEMAVPEKRINSKAIKAWRISGFFYVVPFFILPLLLLRYSQPFSMSPWLAVGLSYMVPFFLLMLIFIFTALRWKHWRYRISEQEIDMMRGIIVIKRTLVPINRVQHVDTRQGPIYKLFGLSSVTISTAATTHEIPALNDEIADDLRNQISTLVRKVKEDV